MHLASMPYLGNCPDDEVIGISFRSKHGLQRNETKANVWHGHKTYTFTLVVHIAKVLFIL